MPERFRGELLTMERYTNPASFTSFTFCVERRHWFVLQTQLIEKNCVHYLTTSVKNHNVPSAVDQILTIKNF